MINPTHTFTNAKDINGNASPLTGLRVTVLHRFGMSFAGYDCAIALHCSWEELAKRINAAYHVNNPIDVATVRRTYEAIGFEQQLDSCGLPVCEANFDEDLTADGGAP